MDTTDITIRSATAQLSRYAHLLLAGQTSRETKRHLLHGMLTETATLTQAINEKKDKLNARRRNE